MSSKITKQQKEKIVRLLESGEDLPEGYKDLLFPNQKKEYELVYAGKERKEDIIAETMAVPLQKMRTFGEVEKSKTENWENKLIFGDNLQILKEIYNDQKGENRLGTKDKIKLIYIDPPFATKQDFMKNGEKVYQDKVIGAEFLEFLRARLILAKEILADDGSIYVHLDQKKGHYVKVLLDEIFGENNFVNEIIWSYRSGGASRKESLPRKHDSILFFRKLDNFQVNTQIERQYLEKSFMGSMQDEKGRFYVDTIVRDVFEGLINSVNKFGKIITFNTRPVLNLSSEGVDYPTQKPEGLLQLLLEISSNEGDIVLDFFAGSGTTLAVAEKLGRKWIGCDCGKLSIYTIQKRILTIANSKSLEDKTEKYQKAPKPFTLFNAGLYDYQKMKDLPWEEYRLFTLNLFEVRAEKHKLAGIELDGFRGNDNVLVFNHHKHKDVVLDYGFIDDLHKNLGAKISNQFFIIAPAGNIDFMEDYIEKGSVRYYILRIPYSIISELHKKDFTNLKQPIDEKDVNNTIEAVGFDFIQVPEVECEYASKKEFFSVKIKNFKSKIRSKKPLKYANRETLSAVMLDWNYDGEVFDLDKVFFAEDLKKNKFEIKIEKNKASEKMMLIYMDIFGNEKKEVKELKDFK